MISTLVQAGAMIIFLALALQFGMLLKGCFFLRRQGRRGAVHTGNLLLRNPQVPEISVVMVAAAPTAEVRALVQRLLGLYYRKHEVVLVLQMPEREFQAFCQEFGLVAGVGRWRMREVANLSILRAEPGGASAAYNAGVEAAAGPVVAFFDPAAEFVPETLLRLIPPMLQDPATVTGSCAVSPGLAAGNLAERFGALASLRLWLGRCAAFAGWNMLIPVPGCCLLLRRDAILQVGGFPAPRRGKADGWPVLDLVLHLHGKARKGGAPFRLAMVPDPVSQLPAPASLEDLRRAMGRDQAEIRNALSHHSSIARGIRAIGWGMPGLVWQRLLLPLLEIALLAVTALGILVGAVPLAAGVLVLLCTVATAILVSMSAVVLRELAELTGSNPVQLSRLFFAAIPENLGYRQWRSLILVGTFFKSKTR